MAGEVISREEARAQGLARYFTGEPCIRGHVGERHVSSSGCLQCTRGLKRASYDPDKNRLSGKLWRDANAEKVKASKREYASRPQAKAQAKARQKEWFQANKDRIREKRQAEYAADPAKRLAGNRAWIEANPERFAEHMRAHARKRRAQKRGSDGSHTAADLAEIFTAQGGRCAYCRVSLRKVKRHVDHIKPLALGGSNGRSNLQFACAACNQAKNAKDPIAFAQERGLLL